MLRLALLTPALLLLSSCAGAVGADGSYSDQLARLNADCVARGGVLSPTGATTGRVETENVCRINGATARAGH